MVAGRLRPNAGHTMPCKIASYPRLESLRLADSLLEGLLFFAAIGQNLHTHGQPARRLTVNGDFVGVAAERGDVLMYPFDCEPLIADAGIGVDIFN